MHGKKITFYILAAFIAGNLLLIYIQYNSAKNIQSLINGNEKLLREFHISNRINDLEKNVISIESKIRGYVSTEDSSYISGMQLQMIEIRSALSELKTLMDNDTTVKYVEALDALVKQKQELGNKTLDSFRTSGKNAAEDIIATQEGRRLTEEIARITDKIEHARSRVLASATASIDISGEKALEFGTMLTIFVLVSACLLFWFIINTIRNQGQLIYQLHISEKKVREAAQVKQHFLANMSHEIRTPLNAILGFTNLLQQEELEGDAGEYVKTIRKSGENLLAIVNDILDLSKIEAGMMRIESVPFSIRGLAHTVKSMFQAKLTEKDLSFTIEADPQLPDILEGDPTRLTQVLVNLAGNAVKFTDRGYIRMKLRPLGISGDIVKTEIIVEDSGVGISAEKQAQIFDRFQQAESSVTRKFGGTGLGLSIVKELILLQGGSIEVTSEVNKGTSFRVVIPYRMATEISGDQPPLLLTENNSLAPGNNCVLVVEDNDINRELLAHILRKWHIEFEMAVNGLEAIEMLKRKNYLLVLMDVQMPEMDGYTAASHIREELKLTVPIIAMTAHAFPGEREKCLSYGMNEYISKPIREDQLYKLVSYYVEAFTTSPVKESGAGAPRQTAGAAAPGDIVPAPVFNGPEPDPAGADPTPFEYINLDYLRELSEGDREYEKKVTGQFLEAVPRHLEALEAAFLQQDIPSAGRIAHNMISTVAVMGLDTKLRPYLEQVEKGADLPGIAASIQLTRMICHHAMREANLFFRR